MTNATCEYTRTLMLVLCCFDGNMTTCYTVVCQHYSMCKMSLALICILFDGQQRVTLLVAKQSDCTEACGYMSLLLF